MVSPQPYVPPHQAPAARVAAAAAAAAAAMAAVTASSSSSAGTRAAADASPQRRLLVMPSLPYMHWASSLSGALAAASCDAAMVCSAEVERGAVSSESSARGAISEPHIATPTTVAHAALSNGRLLGRVLPAPLSEEDLAHLDLLYLGTDDQTLSNLVMLLRGATVFVCDPGARHLRLHRPHRRRLHRHQRSSPSRRSPFKPPSD